MTSQLFIWSAREAVNPLETTADPVKTSVARMVVKQLATHTMLAGLSCRKPAALAVSDGL